MTAASSPWGMAHPPVAPYWFPPLTGYPPRNRHLFTFTQGMPSPTSSLPQPPTVPRDGAVDILTKSSNGDLAHWWSFLLELCPSWHRSWPCWIASPPRCDFSTAPPTMPVAPSWPLPANSTSPFPLLSRAHGAPTTSFTGMMVQTGCSS